MKTLSVTIVALFLISFTVISCEEESTVCAADASYEDYLDSVNSFISNPTSRNCNAMKAAAIDYIDDATSCGGYDVSEAKSTINSIDCSVF